MIPRAINVSTLLDGGAWTGWQKLLTALAALAVIFDGFDIQILAFAIPSLMREWHVPRTDFGPVLALGLAGMAIGGPLSGYIGDRIGRRPALIACVALFGVATITTALVNGVASLSILRFVTGLGAGGALPNAAALAAEFAPLRRRATAVKLTLICVPLGGMIGGLIAAQVLPALGWRALYAIGGAAPLLWSLALWVFLPESPRFLARRPESRQSLIALLNRMGFPTAPDACFEEPGPHITAERFSLQATLRALFSPVLARDTAGLWIAFFFSLGSVYLVFGWLPSLLSAQGLTAGAASSGLAAYNFGGVLGVLVLTAIMTMLGSRGPMLIACLVAAASALALLWVGVGNGLLAGLALNGFLANAIQTGLYAVASHVYPTAVRSSGVACAASLGRVAGLISSLCGAAIIDHGATAYWGCIAIAMILTFAGLASIRNHLPGTLRYQSKVNPE